jgi:hypothetical protein
MLFYSLKIYNKTIIIEIEMKKVRQMQQVEVDQNA